MQRLNQIVVKAMNTQDVRDRMASQGFDVVSNTPEQFSDFLKKDVARWKVAVKESGATLD